MTGIRPEQLISAEPDDGLTVQLFIVNSQAKAELQKVEYGDNEIFMKDPCVMGLTRTRKKVASVTCPGRMSVTLTLARTRLAAIAGVQYITTATAKNRLEARFI